MKKREKKYGIMKCFFRVLPGYFKTNPFVFCLEIVFAICEALSMVAITIFTQRFFDTAALVISASGEHLTLILALLVLGLAHLVKHIVSTGGDFSSTYPFGHAQGIYFAAMHGKTAKLPPILFEDPVFLDEMNKAKQGGIYAVDFAQIIMKLIFFYIPYFVLMGWYLYALSPILLFAIVLVFVPVAISQLIRTGILGKLEDKSAPLRREYEYYENCISSREYLKETRHLGIFGYFYQLYRDTLYALNKKIFKANIKMLWLEISMKAISVVGYFIILILLFRSLMAGNVSVGAFAAVFTSISTLFDMMERIVCYQIGQVAQNLGSVKNYVKFMDTKEYGGKDIDLPSGDIVFSGVSFMYPGSEIKAVNNVSFTIKQGETVAIVGENGSGKSTLAHLIAGLYVPGEGAVLRSNEDTRELSGESLYKNISAVFQKYQRYQMTLGENIEISDVSQEHNEKTLQKVSVMANLDLSEEHFDKKFDTMLSREFNGVDLSGGIWQRVAIARGLYRAHDIIILDEPTAAIDPLEETKIYNRFAELSKDKTAIIITHRLGSVKLASRILMMKEGALCEEGSHEELIDKGGEYAIMFSAQQKWYR